MDLSRLHHQTIMWFYGWKPLMVSYFPTKFGDYKHYCTKNTKYMPHDSASIHHYCFAVTVLMLFLFFLLIIFVSCFSRHMWSLSWVLHWTWTHQLVMHLHPEISCVRVWHIMLFREKQQWWIQEKACGISRLN